MEKQSDHPKKGMARLLEIAAIKKPLVITSAVLSALASVASFIPYIAIYKIISQILASYPSFATLDTASLIRLGWLALGGILLNIALYFAALMCSHLAAFGTLYKLKVDFASHLARVPLGFHVLVGSGKLRKIMDENIEKIEGFIAHQLPEQSADLALLCTVLHEIDAQEAFLTQIAARLKPAGRLAVIEFHKNQTPYGPPIAIRISPEDVLRLAAPSGLCESERFTLGESYDCLLLQKSNG